MYGDLYFADSQLTLFPSTLSHAWFHNFLGPLFFLKPGLREITDLEFLLLLLDSIHLYSLNGKNSLEPFFWGVYI